MASSDHVLLIMQIIKDKNIHGRNYVWKTDNISPTLNFSEKISTFPKQNAL